MADNVVQFRSDPHKLHRTQGPDTSAAAARQTESKAHQAMAYEVFVELGLVGATGHDVRRLWKAPARASFFARITELHQQGLILDTGTRRKGDLGRSMAVYVATALLPEVWLNYIKEHAYEHNPCLWPKEEREAKGLKW